MKKILVVDDDQGVRNAVKEALIAEGHFVATAEDGETAIGIYKQLQPHLVITDMVMPEVEGIQTIRALLELDGDAKIIAMTGYSDIYLKSAVLFGAKKIISKPLQIEELLEAVNSLL